jgi:hypothetical protein
MTSRRYRLRHLQDGELMLLHVEQTHLMKTGQPGFDGELWLLANREMRQRIRRRRQIAKWSR